MGSIISAIADDEEDWYAFKRKHLLVVGWDVYSNEARIAQEFVRKSKKTVTANEIILHVKYQTQLTEMTARHKKELSDHQLKYKAQVELLKDLAV